MCGLAGFTGRGDADILRRMTDAVRHRGPDAEGLWHDTNAGVFLGHRRLSIVDLAGGAQPMWTADRQLAVIFNGEIYNHAELRAELQAKGCQFESDHSDTEVLLHAYREWGASFVERLNGMWAFVIYDRARQQLFGSRDRFGKKPFYYFHDGPTLVFASELTALVQHPAVPRNVSLLSLQKYFAYCYIPAPRSIYERVWKLPGGHSFTFDLAAGDLRISRWWEFILEIAPPGAPGPYSCDPIPGEFGVDDDPITIRLGEEIRETLERAVKRRLMADVPLGVFLSGGIDSSAIAALAAKHVPAGQLNTFSIGFSEPSFDETVYARQVAEKLGARHHEEQLDLDKSRALLPEIIARLDEPLGDASLLPTYLLSRFTRQHVTVALGGDGGDELFAGYDPFRALVAAERYQRRMPRLLHQAVRFMASLLPVSHANMSFDFKLKRTLTGLSYPPRLRDAVWMGALEPAELLNLFGEKTDMEAVYSEAIEAWDRCAQPNIVDRTLQFFTNLYLQDDVLAKVDRASMMCSLEARSPFLDIEVVNLARRIPHRFKLHRGQTKWILKRALASLLPGEIIERKKKGFGVPIGGWFRDGGFDFPETDFTGQIDRSFARRRFDDHRRGHSDQRLFLWCDWLLQTWCSARR